MGVGRLIDWVWWGPTGRGGLAGVAWHVKVGIRHIASERESPRAQKTDAALPTLNHDLLAEVDRAVALTRETTRDERHPRPSLR